MTDKLRKKQTNKQNKVSRKVQVYQRRLIYSFNLTGLFWKEDQLMGSEMEDRIVII